MEKCWSEYQSAVFEFVQSGKGHGVVLARAGSGKTTTIVEACKRTPLASRTLFVAFNKSIADELTRKVPGNTQATTLHSYGFRAVKAAWGRVQVDKDREFKIAEKILPKDTDRGMINALCKLVSMSKAWLTYDDAGLLELAESYECTGNGKFPPKEWVRYAQHVVAECRKPAPFVSFDDMVWLPVELNLRVETFDTVFIDETQDLNRAQVELALRAAGNRGRIIAVGDDRQAIYAFRGADSASIARITERLSAHVMPLSITYRCPRAVVALAQTIVPDLQPSPSAAEGTVNEKVTVEAMLKDAGAGDFVLSRTNAPLARYCLAMLRAGKRAFIRGRDVGAGLAALVRKSNRALIPDFAAWLDSYAAGERERLTKAKKDAQIETLMDRVETLHVLSEGLANTDELLTRLDDLFSDKDAAGRVMFSSTHKAKGLEADRVWMLRSTYRPGKGVEEENLFYVAVTRARVTLNIVTDKV